jgi:succinate-acetate transporter protein
MTKTQLRIISVTGWLLCLLITCFTWTYFFNTSLGEPEETYKQALIAFVYILWLLFTLGITLLTINLPFILSEYIRELYD